MLFCICLFSVEIMVINLDVDIDYEGLVILYW